MLALQEKLKKSLNVSEKTSEQLVYITRSQNGQFSGRKISTNKQIKDKKLACLLEVSDKIGKLGILCQYYRNIPAALHNFKSAVRQFANGSKLSDIIENKHKDAEGLGGSGQPSTIGGTFIAALATENKPHGGIAALIDLKDEYANHKRDGGVLVNDILPNLEAAVDYLRTNFIEEIVDYSKQPNLD